MEFSFLISELHIWSEQFVGGAKKDCEFYTLLLWGPNPPREDIQAFQQKDAVYLSCEDLPVQLVAWGEETVLREKAQLFIASPLTRVELAAGTHCPDCRPKPSKAPSALSNHPAFLLASGTERAT